MDEHEEWKMKIMEAQKESEQPSEIPFYGRDNNNYPKFKFVSKELGVMSGPVTALIGQSNSGKTYAAVNLALAVANGCKLFGKFVVEKGKVLWLDFEGGPVMVPVYFTRVANGMGLTANNVNVLYPSWRLNDESDVEAVEQDLMSKLAGYTLCVIDCFSAMAPDLQHNDVGIRGPIDMLSRVSASTGCAILMLHHERKGKGEDKKSNSRGSSAIMDALGCALAYERKAGSIIATITKTKLRIGQWFEREIEYREEGVWIDSLDCTSDARLTALDYVPEVPIGERILAFLVDGEKKAGQIHALTGGKHDDYQSARDDLIGRKLIVMERKGKGAQYYSLTEDGLVEAYKLQRQAARTVIDEKDRARKMDHVAEKFCKMNGVREWYGDE